MGRLDGKVAIITGGASGIGEASVKLFVQEGCRVIVADLLNEKAEKLVSSLGEKVTFIHTDVTDEHDIRYVVDTAIGKYDRLDVMFNNAGIVGAAGPIQSISVDDFDKTVNVHLRGVFLGIKHAARAMSMVRQGSIINTASTAAIRAGYGNHIYSACKAGITQLTRSVSMELGEKNIRVNCISPGFVPTPMIGIARSLTREQAEGKIQVMEEVFKNAQPIPGPIKPVDIAMAALFLASDDSRFITGHNLVIDGGVTGGRMWTDYQNAVDNLRKALE